MHSLIVDCSICDGLSIVYPLHTNKENVYQKVAEILKLQHGHALFHYCIALQYG